MAAFEALYERYHLQLLSFSRHMVGRVHDAEDVVQHAFMAADRTFRSGKVPKSVRAWLYTVARNRCISLLRSRREEHDLPDAGVPSTENLAADVEQRADLRELLADLRTLPDDQRAALLLSELGDLSHGEVAGVIGVRASKVKALVFQARQNLMASADARAIPCHAIREELSIATGAALRRRHLRNHLAQCDECSEYSARVRAQRASLAAILPVVPTLALRDSVLGALGSGGAAAAAGAGAGGAGAGIGALVANSTAAKVLVIAALGGAAAGGGTVAVSAIDSSGPGRPADRPASNVRSVPAGTAPDETSAVGGDPQLRILPRDDARERAEARERRRAAAKRGERGRKGRDRSSSRRDGAPGQAKRADKKSAPPGSRGGARGHAKQQARDKAAAPGNARPRARSRIVPPRSTRKEAVQAPKAKAKLPAEKLPAPAKAKPAEPVPTATPVVPVADAEPAGSDGNGQAAEGIPTD